MWSSLILSLWFLGASNALPQTGDAKLQGFTAEGLASLEAALRKVVDEKRSAGITTLLARNGKIVNQYTYGVMDNAASAKVPVQKVFINIEELVPGHGSKLSRTRYFASCQ
jgi:hypothetical protein